LKEKKKKGGGEKREREMAKLDNRSRREGNIHIRLAGKNL